MLVVGCCDDEHGHEDDVRDGGAHAGGGDGDYEAADFNGNMMTTIVNIMFIMVMSTAATVFLPT